jgi:ATP-binding cassette subfamily B protein
MREQLRTLAYALRASAAADRRLTWATLLVAPAWLVLWTSYMLLVRGLTNAVVAGDAQDVVVLAVLLGATTAVDPIYWRTLFAFCTTLHERASGELERRLIDDALRAPGLEQHESPEYQDRLRLLRGQMRDLGNPVMLVDVLRGGATLLVSVTLMATVDPLCLLLPCAAIPSVLLAARVERGRVASEARVVTEQRLRQRLFSLQTEPASAKEVKVLGLVDELGRRHRRAWRAAIRSADRVDLRAAALLSASWALFTTALMGVLWLMVWRASQGKVSAGDVMLVVASGKALTFQISNTLEAFAGVQRMLSATRHHRWLTDAAQGTRERARPAGRVPVPARIERSIALEQVTFTYPGRQAPSLRDVSLELPAGSTVALVGENGSGKTTLVKLLCRLYEPTHGRVALDGQDVAAFDHDEWRTRLAAGFQDFVRFELAARETVGVGDLDTIDDVATVRRALADAGAQGFEQRLPHGLDTQLGSRWPGGVELSSGQWQRLALARAFMRPSPLLLILDEPTASLDAATEHQIFARFAAAARASAAKRAITLLVSHRFSTVREADLIVVVEHGTIAEQGSHDALMRTGGVYASLYELQARSYA